jgi:hypothetical protein
MSLNVVPIVATRAIAVFSCDLCGQFLKSNRNLLNDVNSANNEETLEYVRFVIDSVATGVDVFTIAVIFYGSIIFWFMLVNKSLYLLKNHLIILLM